MIVGKGRYIVVIYNPDFDILEKLEEGMYFWRLYYDLEDNIFYDIDGWECHDLYTYVTPNHILIFKTTGDDLLVWSERHQMVIGLFWMSWVEAENVQKVYGDIYGL